MKGRANFRYMRLMVQKFQYSLAKLNESTGFTFLPIGKFEAFMNGVCHVNFFLIFRGYLPQVTF